MTTAFTRASLIVAVLIVAGPAAGKTTTSTAMHGPGYVTAYPSFLHPLAARSIFSRVLSSRPALDVVNIPKRPGVGVSIASLTTPKFRKAVGASPARTLAGVLHQLVGVPRLARGIHQSHPTSGQLDGAADIRTGFQYRYRGRQIMQRDVVTRHHGRIVLVELDADRTQHTDAAKALHSLLGRWRWT